MRDVVALRFSLHSMMRSSLAPSRISLHHTTRVQSRRPNPGLGVRDRSTMQGWAGLGAGRVGQGLTM